MTQLIDVHSELLPVFLEQIEDAIAIVNTEHIYIFANAAYCRLRRTDPATIIGKHVREIVGEDFYQLLVREKLEEVLQGAQVQYESPVTSDAGHTSHLAVSYFPLPDATAPAYVAAVLRDISAPKEQEEVLRFLVENINEVFWLRDLNQDRVIYVSPSISSVFGITPEDMYSDSRAFMRMIDERDLARVQRAFQAVRNKRIDFNEEYRIVHPEKGVRWIHARTYRFESDHKKLFVGTAEDITERKVQEEHVLKSKQHVEALYRGIPLPIFTWERRDDDFVLSSFNIAAVEMTQGKAKHLKGRWLSEVYRDQNPQVIEDIHRCFESRSNLRRQMSYTLVSTGEEKYIEASYVYVPDRHVMAMVNDITHQQQYQEHLKRLSRTDELTGLFNRRHFITLMHKEFSRARRTNERLTLAMLDIDHFKDVNDKYGHDVGDHVLQHLGRILREDVRPYDIAARYGGEEFAICFPDTDLSQADLICERLRTLCAASEVSRNGGTIGFTVRFGLSELRPEHEDLDDLLKSADNALYAAKANGRNRIEHDVVYCDQHTGCS